MCDTRGFVQKQPIAFCVVAENLSVTAPVKGIVHLTLHFVMREVLVQYVAEKLQRKSAVAFSLKRIANLLNQGHVGKNRVSEDLLAGRDIRFGELLAGRGNLDVSLARLDETEQHRLFHNREQIVDFHQQIFGKVI